MSSIYGESIPRAGIAAKRTRKFVYECSHESCGSWLDHHLGVGVNCLTVLVLVGRGDEHGNTLVKILLRDVSERLALRVEGPVCIYRPDDLAPLVIEYLDLYDLALVVGVVFVTSVCYPLGNGPPEILLHLLRYISAISVGAGAFGVVHAL